MKTKKLLSVLSAAAVSATMLSGLAVTASAADIEWDYAGSITTEGSIPEGFYGITTNGRHKNSQKFEETTLAADVSSELKSLYDKNQDGEIDAKYVGSYFNYIGNGNDVNIRVDNLEAGVYTLYYFSGTNNNSMGTVSLDETAGSNVISIGSAVNFTDKYVVFPITIMLTQEYSGNITFSKSDGYLPDLCSIKIVDSALKTQNDVIVANDIARTRSDHDTYTGYTVNENCPEIVKTIFGNKLENAGLIALTYTSGEDDHVYINVTKSSTYTIDLIGAQSTRAQEITFTNIGDNSSESTIVSGNIRNIATPTGVSNHTVNYFTSETNVTLDSGIYKVGIKKTGEEGFYTNFIAMALREVSDPEPQPETLNMKNEGVAKGTGANTGTYATMFSAKVEDFNGTPKTVAVTSGENTRSFDVKGTVLTEATAIYGLIVNGLNDDGAEAVITFE